MRFTTPIFRKLLLGALVLIAVLLIVVDVYLSRYVAGREIEHVEQRLAAQSRILAGQLAAVPRDELERWVHDAYARAGARVTLIDPTGVVLADSDRNSQVMENHNDRPEVAGARATGTAAAIRASETVGRDLCYVALAVRYQNASGHVLRLAVPLEDIEAAVTAVRLRILAISLVAALAALGLAWLLSRSFSRRVAGLREFAERVADSHFAQEPLAESEDELGSLARSLNRMSARLRGLVEGLGAESARRDAILAGMVEGVLAVDDHFRVIFCNDAFARLVGHRAPPPERLPVTNLVNDETLIDMIRRAVDGESGKKRLQLAGAAGRSFEVQVTPFSSPPGRGAIALLHDITDLERLERVRRDFVANVSHELRTPLTAIRGYAETLLEGGLEDRENNRRFAEIIKTHAIRLNNIAADLLTLSDLEHRQPELEPVSLRAALDTALNTVEPEARARNVKLVREHLDEGFVLAQRVRFEQALVNLLDNAVKFNREGGEVRIEGRCEDGRARISISDTGIGIPADHLARIFERFYRVDKARSRDVGGTGLGLSIVKHVVERMNGSLAVRSEEGAGSTFTMLVPLAAPPAS